MALQRLLITSVTTRSPLPFASLLNVLKAQRSLYASQDAMVQSTGTVSTNLVALYKALGGGWEAEEKNL